MKIERDDDRDKKRCGVVEKVRGKGETKRIFKFEKEGKKGNILSVCMRQRQQQRNERSQFFQRSNFSTVSNDVLLALRNLKTSEIFKTVFLSAALYNN